MRPKKEKRLPDGPLTRLRKMQKIVHGMQEMAHQFQRSVTYVGEKFDLEKIAQFTLWPAQAVRI